jgi:hypothetical protein
MAFPHLPPQIHISSHPCIKAKLSILRSQSTTNARDVKALIHEIATMVACEAFAHSLKPVPTGTVRRAAPKANHLFINFLQFLAFQPLCPIQTLLFSYSSFTLHFCNM